MKKWLVTLTLMLSMASLAQAQVYFEEKSEEESDSVSMPSFRDRLYFGGNLALDFFSRNKFFEISPLVGYMVTPQYSVGGGFIYQYTSREFLAVPSGDRFTVSSSVYGGRIFNRYNVTPEYFAYAEFESLSARFGVGDALSKRDWVPGLFFGGGTSMPFFQNGGGGNLMVLYNVLHNNVRSPYNSQWVIRCGITL